MNAARIPHPFNLAELARRFGPLPLERIWPLPAPGTATREDFLQAAARGTHLIEFVDGVILEKTVGARESYLAALLLQWLSRHVRDHGLGVCLGPDGLVQLADSVRAPDIAYIPWERLQGVDWWDAPVLPAAPALAVEILSPSNTTEEMTQKRHEYFAATVLEVWEVDPRRRSVRRYTGPETLVEFGERDEFSSLLLPDFEWDLKAFFAPPHSR